MTIAVTAPAPVDVRARDAALACIGRFGLAKTTIDDIAREAGCSPGHALPLLRRQARDRRRRGRRPSTPASPRSSSTPDAPRRRSPTRSSRSSSPARASCAGHDALQFLLAHEPEAVLGHLAFGPGDRVLIAVGDAIAPAFDRWLVADGRDPRRRLAGAPRAFVRAHAAPTDRLHRPRRRARVPRTARDPRSRRKQEA